jgi:RimJ/RimL family protein N-acetyltransferase
MVPVLETPRLILRGHAAGHLGESLALWSDPAVVRHLGGRPFTEEEVWMRLLRYAGGWALLGYGFWRVEMRETGAFVGDVGFHELHRGSEPSFSGEPEVGWVLRPEFHGKGLAREALDAALAWGDARIMAPRFACIIHPENAPSLRLAEATGFIPSDEITYHGGPMCLLFRSRPGASA